MISNVRLLNGLKILTTETYDVYIKRYTLTAVYHNFIRHRNPRWKLNNKTLNFSVEQDQSNLHFAR